MIACQPGHDRNRAGPPGETPLGDAEATRIHPAPSVPLHLRSRIPRAPRPCLPRPRAVQWHSKAIPSAGRFAGACKCRGKNSSITTARWPRHVGNSDSHSHSERACPWSTERPAGAGGPLGGRVLGTPALSKRRGHGRVRRIGRDWEGSRALRRARRTAPVGAT